MSVTTPALMSAPCLLLRGGFSASAAIVVVVVAAGCDAEGERCNERHDQKPEGPTHGEILLLPMQVGASPRGPENPASLHPLY